MADYWHLWLGGLFLKPEAYVYQRDRRNPLAHGLLFIIVIGVIVALAGILGAGLRFAFSPNADAVKNTVLNHLEAMPFYTTMAPAAQIQFQAGYDNFWNNFGGALLGYPINGGDLGRLLATIVTTPLFWIIGWLVYGLLVHLVARGRAHPEHYLASALGTIALATSPQLLNVVSFLPNAGVSGIVLGLWTMICNVFAIRTAYRLTTAHAIWAALFPLLLLLIVLIVLSCIGTFGFGALLSALVKGGRP